MIANAGWLSSVLATYTQLLRNAAVHSLGGLNPFS